MSTSKAFVKTTLPALSLRTRLLLLIFALALPVAAALWGFLLDQRALQIKQAQTQLQSAAHEMASDIDNEVRGALQLVTGLAHDALLDSGGHEDCSRLLAQILQRQPQYTGLATFTPDGALKCDGTLGGRSFSIKDRPYFERGLHSQLPFAAAVQIGRGSGLAVLPVVHGARDADGTFKFLLLAAINLDALSRQLLRGRLPADTVMEIWSADGTLLARTEGARELLGKKYPDAGISLLVQQVKSDSVSKTTGITGVPRVWALAVPAQTSEADLRVAVGMAEEVLLAPARSAFVKASALFALVLFASLAFAWWLAERWISKPMKRLAAVAAQFQAGQFGMVGGPYARDEIGAVTREFDRAAAAIGALTMGLEHRVAERTAQIAVERDRAEASEERLRVKNDDLKGFAYTVSHDLKAPLRGISGYAQELERRHKEGLAERAQFCITQIVVASKNLDQLIEDLLTYSRLEAETPTLGEVPLDELVQSILRDRSLTLTELGAEVSVQVPSLVLLTWERGMHQVLTNLIDNALKYSRTATPPRLSIVAEVLPTGVRVRVTDNGIGFDMKYHDRIFGLFNRLVRASEFEGTGAGLAIVKKLLDKLGGSIRAESAPGQGATFIVELPSAVTPANSEPSS